MSHKSYSPIGFVQKMDGYRVCKTCFIRQQGDIQLLKYPCFSIVEHHGEEKIRVVRRGSRLVAVEQSVHLNASDSFHRNVDRQWGAAQMIPVPPFWSTVREMKVY